MKQQTITFIDKLTGETVDLTYTTIEEAEQLYLQIASMYKALERAKGKLTEFIGKEVEDEYEFGDSSTGKWVQGSRKKYRMEDVRKYLDEDQIALVTDINSTKLKDFFSQLLDDGKGIPGAWKDIDTNADVTYTKKYFLIKKR